MSLIYSKETWLKALLDKGFRGDMESTSFQSHIESDVGMQKPIDKQQICGILEVSERLLLTFSQCVLEFSFDG